MEKTSGREGVSVYLTAGRGGAWRGRAGAGHGEAEGKVMQRV